MVSCLCKYILFLLLLRILVEGLVCSSIMGKPYSQSLLAPLVGVQCLALLLNVEGTELPLAHQKPLCVADTLLAAPLGIPLLIFYRHHGPIAAPLSFYATIFCHWHPIH